MQTSPNLAAAKSVVRNPWAWPGGYPRFLVTTDGAALCPTCVRAEFSQIAYSDRHDLRDGWGPEGADINWEDQHLFCDHCGNQIEPAYPED